MNRLEIQVLRWKSQEVRSGILSVAASYGQPLGVEGGDSDADAEYFRLADTQGGARNFLGLVTRDVVAGGPSYLERMTGVRHFPNEDSSPGPHAMELPDHVGGAVTARMPEEIEAEGSTYLLTSGTGALDAAGVDACTPGVTEIGIVNGKFRRAQSGDGKVGVLTAKGLTPVNSDNPRRIAIRFY